MRFENLQKKLVVWDNVLKEALDTCKSEDEKRITTTTVNIKKMELLNNYMIEACTDSELLTAIKQYSELALDAVSELVKMYRTNS